MIECIPDRVINMLQWSFNDGIIDAQMFNSILDHEHIKWLDLSWDYRYDLIQCLTDTSMDITEREHS